MSNIYNPYQYLPTSPSQWNDIIEPAKDVYWTSRRNNKTETEALLMALNEAFGALERQGGTIL